MLRGLLLCPQVEQRRFFAIYYRVALFGEQFKASTGNQNGLFAEFIYRELPDVRLTDFVKKLEVPDSSLMPLRSPLFPSSVPLPLHLLLLTSHRINSQPPAPR